MDRIRNTRGSGRLRTKYVMIRLTPDEKLRLEKITASHKLKSVSDLVRLWIGKKKSPKKSSIVA